MKENSQDNSSLTLRMEYFIREAGHEVATSLFHGRQLATQSVIKSLKLGHHHLMNQVRQVLVQSCSNLRLGLDLVIQSTILPTYFNQGNAAKTFQHRNNLTRPPLKSNERVPVQTFSNQPLLTSRWECCPRTSRSK